MYLTFTYCVGTSTTAALVMQVRLDRLPSLILLSDAQSLHLGSKVDTSIKAHKDAIALTMFKKKLFFYSSVALFRKLSCSHPNLVVRSSRAWIMSNEAEDVRRHLAGDAQGMVPKLHCTLLATTRRTMLASPG